MNKLGDFSPEDKEAGRATYNEIMKSVLETKTNKVSKYQACKTLYYAGVCHVASAALNLTYEKVMGEGNAFTEKEALEAAKRWIEDELAILQTSNKSQFLSDQDK